MGDIIENLHLTDLAEKGRALGRAADGRVVFVRRGAPGDTVSAEIIKDHGSYLEAKLVEVVVPSADRVAPFCEHFGMCGGCSWQHLSYAGQLAGKQRVVEAALRRIGHLELPEIKAILPSPLQRRYRNKLEFTFTQRRWLDDRDAAERALIGDGAADKRGLGFHLPGRFDSVFSVRECHLQPEPSNAIRLALLARARELGLPFYNLRARRPGEGGYLRTFTLRNTQSDAWMALLLVSEDRPDDLEALLAPLVAQFPQVRSWMYAISAKGNQTLHGIPVRCFAGVPVLEEKLEHLSFELSAASFFQPNPQQAVHLYRAALDMAGLTGTERVYDLYCGTGTISLLAAKQAAEVVGIEYVPAAVADARANAERNGIGNARFFAGDMAALLTPDFIAREGAPDVVIVDPPRAGMAPEVVARLAEAAPARIVYVSCNPATQARDLALLADRYAITAVQPVDMFPQTDHVENVVGLARR